MIGRSLPLEVDSTSNSTAVEVSFQESIINAIDNDALLDPTTMPEVITVQYLNGTYNSYIKSITTSQYLVTFRTISLDYRILRRKRRLHQSHISMRWKLQMSCRCLHLCNITKVTANSDNFSVLILFSAMTLASYKISKHYKN